MLHPHFCRTLQEKKKKKKKSIEISNYPTPTNPQQLPPTAQADCMV
jgi:hypothetical protein